MARYIDGDKLVQKINAYVISAQDVPYIKELIDEMEPAYVTPVIDVEYIEKLINEMEPEDVAPVIHAHWAYDIDDLFPADSMMICSNCGEYERLGANDNYCGNCGAKMDEVNDG